MQYRLCCRAAPRMRVAAKGCHSMQWPNCRAFRGAWSAKFLRCIHSADFQFHVEYCHSLLVNCKPWPQWIMTFCFGLHGQSALNKVCKAKSAVMRNCVDHPTTRFENRSIATTRNDQTSRNLIKLISVAQTVFGASTSHCRSSVIRRFFDDL